MFLKDFEDFLTKICTLDQYVIIMGDLNINMLDTTCIVAKNFLTLLESFDLVQLVTDSTHIKNGMLDLLIASKELNLKQPMITVDNFFRTDHFPVCFLFKSEKPESKPLVKYVRNYKNINIDLFKSDLTKKLSGIKDQESQSNLNFASI